MAADKAKAEIAEYKATKQARRVFRMDLMKANADDAYSKWASGLSDEEKEHYGNGDYEYILCFSKALNAFSAA